MHRPGSATPQSASKGLLSPLTESSRAHEPFTEAKITIPVHIKSQDRDERLAQLTIFASFKTINSSHHQTLVIEVTDDQDPLFLYILECGETEFHVLKDDQGLLVDFLFFPQMIVELLTYCTPNSDFGSRYICSMSKGPTEAQLLVVELSAFKQLVHLSLKFRQGQHEMLEKHLSKNLIKLKDDNAQLQGRIRALEGALGEEKRGTAEMKERFTRLEMEKDRILTQAESEMKSKVSDTRELMMHENDRIKQQSESQLRDLRERTSSEIQRLQEDLAALTLRCRTVIEEKAVLEQEYSDMGRTNKQMQHELEIMHTQLEPLRAGNLKLTSSQSQQERSITELSLKVQNYEQQLRDKEGIIEKLNELKTSMGDQLRQKEEETASLKAQVRKFEDKLALSVQEINKGNQIIEKLQNRQKAKREKLKLKSAVLLQQEDVINKKQAQIEDCEREKYALQREITTREERIRATERAAAELQRQIEEKDQLLQENRQHIAFLNKESSKNRTISPAFSKPPTPGMTSTFKPTSYNLEALRNTPVRSPLTSSSNLSGTDPEPAPRIKDPVKYKEPGS